MAMMRVGVKEIWPPEVIVKPESMPGLLEVEVDSHLWVRRWLADTANKDRLCRVNDYEVPSRHIWCTKKDGKWTYIRESGGQAQTLEATKEQAFLCDLIQHAVEKFKVDRCCA